MRTTELRCLRRAAGSGWVAGAAILAVASLAPTAGADVTFQAARSVVRLPNGNTLIADGGQGVQGLQSRVLEVAPDGHLAAAWLQNLNHVHTAEPIGPGVLLVTDTWNDRVLEIDAQGTILWNSDDHAPFSDGSTLGWPNDANRLPNGNLLITDRDGHRILELDHAGQVLWQFGETGVAGSDLQHLNQPHNADRLANGNTIVADTQNRRILEIDPSGTVVWIYQPTGAGQLNLPRDADRLPNGNTLIADSKNDRILEVDPAGKVVWTLTGVVQMPFEADRLPSGNTLVSDGNARVVEVDASGAIVWQYPGTVATTWSVAWIPNPTSGVQLFAHIHEPADASSGRTYPAVVYVPGGSGSGGGFHSDADDLAAEGFIAVHFDPDGRGQSTNGGTYTTEDYDGFLQQDGLKAVLDAVVALPEVDDDAVGIYSNSYGITMASGMLARYQDQPPVRFLLDWEGPADRYDTATVYGGHVPVPPSDNVFWSEREAATFLPAILPQYVRLQTQVDHNPSITDNHHAIALLNGGTNTFFTGGGISTFTRANRSFDNPPNTTYTIPNPAVWIPESLQPHRDVIETLLLHERVGSPTMTVGGNLVPGGNIVFAIDLGQAMGSQLTFFALSLGDGPTVIPGVTTIHLDLDAFFLASFTVGVLDASGRSTFGGLLPVSPSLIGSYHTQAIYTHPASTTGFSATTGVPFAVTSS